MSLDKTDFKLIMIKIIPLRNDSINRNSCIFNLSRLCESMYVVRTQLWTSLLFNGRVLVMDVWVKLLLG